MKPPKPQRTPDKRDERSIVVDRLRALIIPGNPDEQRRRRLGVLEDVRRGYTNHWGGEPPWLLELEDRVSRGEPMSRADLGKVP